ncbi:hypothetical protein C8R43DRAFT_923043 [Mycena crocata]|nr:hypothetical protein C8R43DRAFT_923043 [Mycena crocata]
MTPCWKCGAPSHSGLATRLPLAVPLPPAQGPSLDLTRLLVTNEAPPESTIPLIYCIISEEERLVEDLESQIERMQVALTQLIERRKETQESVHQHRAILSPVRRLPPELICEIFMLLRSAQDRNAPWHLGWICQSWRRIAISYPHLWCTFYTRVSGCIPGLETQLLRSAQAPLYVSFDGVYDEALQPLFLHCGRWSTLRIRGSYMDDASNFLHLAAGRAVQLKHLEVLCGDIEGLDDFLSTVTTLREVLLTNRTLIEASPLINIAWDQITVYRGRYRAENHLQILQAAPNLRECSLGCVLPWLDEPEAPPTTPISLLHLRRLYLDEYTLDKDDPGLLRHLTAPMLKDLLFHPRDGLQGNSLLPFIQRSACTLTKLVLNYRWPGKSSDLIDVIQALPTLTYLFVDGGFEAGGQTALFQAMTTSDSSHDLCPNLGTLFYGSRLKPIPHDPFDTMIRSRFGRCTFVRIFTFDDLTPNLSAAIEAWRAEGLDVAWLAYDDEKITAAASGY